MEKLNLESTKSTPKVIGDNIQGTLIITGNCFPENSLSFFNDINSWIDLLPKDLKFFNLECELNYIASSSIIHILKIMQKIETLFPIENISIKWKYEIDDEDIQKLGEEFDKLTKSSMELISVEV